MTPTKAIQAFDKRHNEFSEMLLTIHESEDSSRERCEKVIEGYAEVADAFQTFKDVYHDVWGKPPAGVEHDLKWVRHQATVRVVVGAIEHNGGSDIRFQVDHTVPSGDDPTEPASHSTTIKFRSGSDAATSEQHRYVIHDEPSPPYGVYGMEEAYLGAQNDTESVLCESGFEDLLDEVREIREWDDAEGTLNEAKAAAVRATANKLHTRLTEAGLEVERESASTTLSEYLHIRRFHPETDNWATCTVRVSNHESLTEPRDDGETLVLRHDRDDTEDGWEWVQGKVYELLDDSI